MSHWKTFLEAGVPAGRYLPWREVARATGLSRTTAWRLQKRDEFPAPYAISPGRVGYREDEVDAWRASRDHSPARARIATTERAATAGPAPKAAAVSVKPIAATACTSAASTIMAECGAGPSGAPSPRSVVPTAGHASRRGGSTRRRSQHAQAIAQQMLFDF